MTDWQRIDTAPIDQRSILAAHENSGQQKVCWRYAVGDDRYEYGAGTERLWRPTHWKPLGDPPRKPNFHKKAGTPLLGSDSCAPTTTNREP